VASAGEREVAQADDEQFRDHYDEDVLCQPENNMLDGA